MMDKKQFKKDSPLPTVKNLVNFYFRTQLCLSLKNDSHKMEFFKDFNLIMIRKTVFL